MSRLAESNGIHLPTVGHARRPGGTDQPLRCCLLSVGSFRAHVRARHAPRIPSRALHRKRKIVGYRSRLGSLQFNQLESVEQYLSRGDCAAGFAPHSESDSSIQGLAWRLGWGLRCVTGQRAHSCITGLCSKGPNWAFPLSKHGLIPPDFGPSWSRGGLGLTQPDPFLHTCFLSGIVRRDGSGFVSPRPHRFGECGRGLSSRPELVKKKLAFAKLVSLRRIPELRIFLLLSAPCRGSRFGRPKIVGHLTTWLSASGRAPRTSRHCFEARHAETYASCCAQRLGW